MFQLPLIFELVHVNLNLLLQQLTVHHTSATGDKPVAIDD
jgi:hypothetical protein